MKSVFSPRGFTPWLLVALLALPVSAGAAPFDPSTLLGRLRSLISSIWPGPVRKIAPPPRGAKPSRPPVQGDYGCEIEPSGLCKH
ncbi:MAG TPA: hypothetical protein VN851_17590 [Thermoanaerobaculia bacterium]|nr:hypothetical protein [Thermoanaerobaculia bacterium]